ncbi:taste receptor type 2 member 9-like [Pogoniulus pusillus]|uniref:taste receptor type 2 member 9-like n=1 Tax=Pogoniulus pusillus TaxID=488313 RepID=UPI0030B974E2
MAACSSQENFNATSYDAMAFVIITLQTLAGTWINGFIVCVLCVSWVKKKVFNSNEKILLLLGCLRIGDLCITWLYMFFAAVYPHCFYVLPIPQMFSATRIFCNSSNMWVSASLCVFYCLKIANFQHTFFIYLKAKIDRIVPWLFLVSVLLSLVMSILSYNIIYMNTNATTSANLWKLSIRMEEHLFPTYFFIGLILTAAFTAAIFSALLLLFSLCRHKRRMQTNSMRNLSMDAHIKAIKSILSFIFLYSINYIGTGLALICANKMGYLPTFFISIFQYALAVLHSLILIFSNTNLEKAFLRTLPCVKWRFH